MTPIFVKGVGLVAPGLVDWEQARPVLCGDAAYGAAPLPKLTPQILPGITRMALLKLLDAHGIEAHEADLTLQEALGMDESFLTATSYDIRPIEALDGNLYASSGPNSFTAAIMELFEAHIQEVVDKGSIDHAREVQ